MDTIDVGRGGVTLRYAFKIARRLEMEERDIHSMVEALEEPLEFMALTLSTVGERYDDASPSDGQSSTSARILAVTRALETLVDGGCDREKALYEIKRRAGTDLDPVIVGELLSVIRVEDIAWVAGGSDTESSRNTA